MPVPDLAYFRDRVRKPALREGTARAGDLSQDVSKGVPLFRGPVQGIAAGHRQEVLQLVLQGPPDTRPAVLVDDGLEGAAIVRCRHSGQRPLHQPVPGWVLIALEGHPRENEGEHYRGARAEPAPVGQAPPERDRGNRDQPKDAGSMREISETHESPQEHDRERLAAEGRLTWGCDERQRGEDERGGQQLWPDEEAVHDDHVADERGDDHERAGATRDAGSDHQRPHPDDPELLEDHPQHLVVRHPFVPAEDTLREHVADLKRRPVAEQPTRLEDRWGTWAPVEHPIREEPGDEIVAGEKARLHGEPILGHLDVFDFAMQEAEEEDEERGERPEAERD